MPGIRELLSYDFYNPHGAGTSTHEKLFIHSLLAESKFPLIMEIGVSRGHMTLWMAAAQALHGGKMISVDNYSKVHGGSAVDEKQALKRLKDNNLDHIVDFVTSDSVEFLKEQETDSFDFIWVDGDHSFNGALDDITEAFRVAKTMIGVHDTNQQLYDGPKKAAMNAELIMSKQGLWINGLRGIWLCQL